MTIREQIASQLSTAFPSISLDTLGNMVDLLLSSYSIIPKGMDASQLRKELCDATETIYRYGKTMAHAIKVLQNREG